MSARQTKEQLAGLDNDIKQRKIKIKMYCWSINFTNINYHCQYKILVLSSCTSTFFKYEDNIPEFTSPKPTKGPKISTKEPYVPIFPQTMHAPIRQEAPLQRIERSFPLKCYSKKCSHIHSYHTVQFLVNHIKKLNSVIFSIKYHHVHKNSKIFKFFTL